MRDDDIFARDEGGEGEAFALREEKDFAAAVETEVHVFRGHTCDTERRGETRSRLEIVVDASEGFIPLWERNVTLRWRFQERSLLRFRYPERVKDAVRSLLTQAVTAWGEAAPVRFSEQSSGWDFEIAVRDADRCTPVGCTLASAFFPDQGQHELAIYPKMFSLPAEEQVETMAHEIGHIFGLRHFFALTDESTWPARIFGRHESVSIMNYGDNSRLSEADRADLKTLYELVWSGRLTDINRTPIRLMRPFSSLRV